jgi:hypothetical protein
VPATMTAGGVTSQGNITNAVGDVAEWEIS